MADPEIPRDEVGFWTGGVECAADLYIVDNPVPGPGVVLATGYAMTKQSVRAEASYLTAAGYNVMAIDYRTFGMSPGEPRGQLFPRRQVEDLRNALTYFGRRPEVDGERLGLYGFSYSGGLSVQTAAMDRRVKACVAYHPWTDGRRLMRELRSSLEWHGLLDQLQQDFEDRYGPDGVGRTVSYDSSAAFPVPDSLRAMMPPMDPDNPNVVAYATECQETFDPMIALESIERILDFRPGEVIDLIAPRALMIIGNGGAFDWTHPTPVDADFARAGQPKELVLLPYDGFGLYQEPGRGAAMRAAIGFYDLHLDGAAG